LSKLDTSSASLDNFGLNSGTISFALSYCTSISENQGWDKISSMSPVDPRRSAGFLARHLLIKSLH
jgi:hypothetical protein